MSEHLLKNIVADAVTIGVSTIDENAVRFKSRTAAKSYMNSKPIQFGIRYYAVVGWDFSYLNSVWDIKSVNKR